MKRSHQGLYFQARGGLETRTDTSAETRRTVRKPRRRPDQRTSRFVDPMIMISERPAEVEDRAVPGHWEGDLIAEANKTAIATLVERTTRYTMLSAPARGHHADRLSATVWSPRSPPCWPTLRDPLTWDQGCEMARHQQFAMATDMPVYFCDPPAPGSAGTNENTNARCASTLQRHRPERLQPRRPRTRRPATQSVARRKTLDWDTQPSACGSTTASLNQQLRTTLRNRPEHTGVFYGLLAGLHGPEDGDCCGGVALVG